MRLWLEDEKDRGPFGLICDRGAVISCRQIVALYLLRAADAPLGFTWSTWAKLVGACNSEIIKSARYFMNSSWAADGGATGVKYAHKMYANAN